MPEIVTRRIDDRFDVMVRSHGQDQVLPALWLRERSREPADLDLITQQRLMNPHLLPDELHIVDAQLAGRQLTVAFSDGARCRFDVDDVLMGLALDDGCPPPTRWRSDLSPLPYHDWAGLAEEGALLAAVEDFIRLGFIILRDTPIDREAILTIARRFGFVRETNFGRYFEVYSRPDSNDLAYRPVALGPHTDNPYRTPVPGIQLLHCLINETRGGLSTLVDSLAVAEVLRAEDPQGFELLARIPVRYRFRDADTELTSIKPMIEVNGRGEMTGVHYSPRLDDLPLMSEDDTRAYHRARKRLGTLFAHPDFELRFRLQAGELMMFDNNRVLHGRTAFDPSEGHRHLQGCYIDRDGPRSLYRVLRRRLAMTDPQTEAAA